VLRPIRRDSHDSDSSRSAAFYCRRSVKKFETQCTVRPVKMADGDLLWDVHDLDGWIDGLKSSTDKDDPDKIVARLA